jgi:hypothetical protein
VADAEKAFVSLLKPEYNRIKYAGYPRGKDGLYKSGFANYARTSYVKILRSIPRTVTSQAH